MGERWSISLHKDYLKFSCAHFLIHPDGSKERLHGHNYHVACEIEGELTDRGLVIDFDRAKPLIKALCDELDEHFLIPERHPDLTWRARDDGHTEVAYRDCRYLAPTAEVIVLPLDNISVENLAAWLGRRLRERIVERFGAAKVRRLRVAVSETIGQDGVYRYRADG